MADETAKAEGNVAPSLPAGASVDFNALNDALLDGKDPDAAAAAGVIEGTVFLSADEARARAAASVAELPSLARLTRAQLDQIVLDETVVVPETAKTNADIVAAIEEARAARAAGLPYPPLPPVDETPTE